MSNGNRKSIYIGTIVFSFLLSCASDGDLQVRDEGIIAQGPIEEYIGSSACVDCHEKKYKDWSGKRMSHFVRYGGESDESLPGSWIDSPIKPNEVNLIVGGKRKLAFVGHNWEVFPYQYHIEKQKWQERSGWIDQDYRLRCGPCHTVGLNPKTKRFVENNIGCEACHGPGRRHCVVPGEQRMSVPGKTDGKNVLATCRRCHNERRKHARAIKEFSGVFHGNGK